MRTTLRAEVSGVSNLIRVGARHANETAYGLARGIVKAAKFLLGKSRELVPYDTWKLHNTSRVKESGRGMTKTAEVIYDQPYAVYQHENPNYKHKSGRTYKYLERPARQYRSEMRDMVKREARKKR